MKRISSLRRACAAAGIIVLTLTQVHLSSASAQTSSQEARIRALIIARTLSLITWPEGHGQELNFCGLGNSAALTQLTESKRTQDALKPYRVNFLTEASADKPCHVQIVGTSQSAYSSSVGDNALLTICDSCSGAEAFATIELVKVQDRIKFNIYLPQARKNNIKISSSLLELAHSVSGYND